MLAALGADGTKILLAHVMPWYETPAVRKNWGFHWSSGNPPHNPEKLDENGLPDIRSHFHPLIGLYDSSNPEVLECQLLQMKIAVCYEDSTIEALIKNRVIHQSEIPSHLKEMTAWLAAHWFSAPQYFHFGGRPLLLNLGPIYVKDRDAWAACLELSNASEHLPVNGYCGL